MVHLLLPLLLLADPFQGGFPVDLPLTANGPSLTDVGWLSPEPAGAHGRLVVKDGHFVDGTGRRVRLFGTNLTFSSVFPTHAGAERTAARLKRFGFNAVRLHHLDGRTAPNGIWKDNAQTAFDPDQLDRLDYLLAQLKANGIWIDLNLHISRDYPEAPIRQLPRTFNYGKVIDHYHPALIASQKAYATKLLTHENPYTKTTYGQDPAISILEINNENTLVGQAFNPDLALLPADLQRPLLDGWHAWLKQRYGTLEKVVAAWQQGSEPLGETLIAPTDTNLSAEAWRLEASSGAQGTLTVEPTGGPDGQAAFCATLTKAGGVAWAFQVHRLNLDLVEGKTYTLEFAVKADAPRRITVGTRLQVSDWHAMGLSTNVELTTKWQRRRVAFTAANVVPHQARLSFTLGSQPGVVQIAGVRLRRGAGLDLSGGTAIEALPLGLQASLQPERTDWIRYLIDVEHDYVASLRRHLREVVKTPALVIHTQASYGGAAGVLREAGLSDFVDMHAYWQHPHFPNRPWDSKDWSVPNTSMVANANGGTLKGLAEYRVAGLPFTVSEYDHPAPSFYSGELFPMLATYAAEQDWDGVFQFDWASTGELANSDRLTGYFGLATHPGKLAFAPAAAVIFRQGLLAPVPPLTLELSRGSIAGRVASGGGALGRAWQDAGVKPDAFIHRALHVTLVDGDAAPRLVGEQAPAPAGPLAWRAQPAEQAEYVAVSEQSAVISGRIGGRTVTAGPLSVTLQPTPRNSATVSLVSLDGRPLSRSGKLLLTICGAVANQGMGWNDTFTSVSNQWGHGPVLAEPLTAEIKLTTAVNPLAVETLDGAGQSKMSVGARQDGGVLTFTVDPQRAALWYTLTGRAP